MIKAIVLVGVAVFFASSTVCMPTLLGNNVFLEGFVTHEILGLMSVILTVTLASVANIHLALNRIVLAKFSKKIEMVEAAKAVKKELSDNAWYIFWGFSVVGTMLIVKGGSSNIYLHSFVNGASTWVLLLYIFCMYDIYRVVFGMTQLELDLGLPGGKSISPDAPEFEGGEG